MQVLKVFETDFHTKASRKKKTQNLAQKVFLHVQGIAI